MIRLHVVALCLALASSAMAADTTTNPMSGKSVAELGNVLNSNAPEMDRANAALALAELVTPPKVEKRQKAPEWELKIPASFIETCTIGLRDRSSAVRFYSGQALARAGADALPALIQAVQSDNDDCKIAAIHAIGMMAKSMAGKKGSPEVELTSVFGSTVPALRKALQDENHIVREATCATFSRLGTTGEPAIDELIALLDDGNFCVVNRAVHAVAAVDPAGVKSVPALVRALESKHDVREFIVKELGDMGQAAKGAVPALCRLVGEDKNSWHVALESTKALLKIVTYEEKPQLDAMIPERKQALRAIAQAIAAQDATFLQARIRNTLFDHSGYCPIGGEIEPLMPWLETTLREWAKAEPGHYPPPVDKLCLLLAKIGRNYERDYVVSLAKELKSAKDTKEAYRNDFDPILNLEDK